MKPHFFMKEGWIMGREHDRLTMVLHCQFLKRQLFIKKYRVKNDLKLIKSFQFPKCDWIMALLFYYIVSTSRANQYWRYIIIVTFSNFWTTKCLSNLKITPKMIYHTCFSWNSQFNPNPLKFTMVLTLWAISITCTM